MAECTTAANQAGQQAASLRGYKASFAKVLVKIAKIAGTDVHFIPTGQTAAVVTTWSEPDVWPDCPTNVDLVKNATGFAMLGGHAYGQMSPAAKAIAGPLKWPEAEILDRRMRKMIDLRALKHQDARPDPRARWGYTEGKITITSLRVEGVIDGEDDVTNWELVSPELPSKFDLDFTKFDSQVTILRDGDPERVQMQILHAFVTGCGEVEATDIDMRNPQYGDPYQIIRVGEGYATLTLSQKGCALFGVAFDP